MTVCLVDSIVLSTFVAAYWTYVGLNECMRKFHIKIAYSIITICALLCELQLHRSHFHTNTEPCTLYSIIEWKMKHTTIFHSRNIFFSLHLSTNYWHTHISLITENDNSLNDGTFELLRYYFHHTLHAFYLNMYICSLSNY